MQRRDNINQLMEPLFPRLRTKSNAAAFERQAKGFLVETHALEQDTIIRDHGSMNDKT